MKLIYGFLLLIEGPFYNLVAYSFKIFQLMCTVNADSIYGIAKPLVDRLQAVIIVFVVYLLAISLIQYLLEPDKALDGGKKFLVNLFIAAALFLGYNFVFNVFNELNIALMGNQVGYKYTTLGEVFDLTDEDGNGTNDKGLIMRFAFGTNDIEDPGQSIALSLAGVFIRDHGSDGTSYVTSAACPDADKPCNFNNLNNKIPAQITSKRVDYTPIIGLVVCLFVIYSMFSASIQIGIRMFKLLILQMLAPIVIVDVIKNGTGGKFKSYCNKYISVFLEAMVRMLTIMIITVFVSKFLIHIKDYFPSLDSNQDFMTRLIIMVIVVIAAYMFAGQVPKFIDEIIGTHISDSSGKGGFGHFVGSMVGGVAGAGIGTFNGLATGTLAGTIAGGVGGAMSGSKGKNVADFFKGQAANSNKARSIGANSRMAGGTMPYLGSKVSSFLGRPQRKEDRGKLASERQTAMDNMIKTLEDNYDRKITYGVGANQQQVGLDRDKFREEAYARGYGRFAGEISDDTKAEIDKVNQFAEAYSTAQLEYENKRAQGVATEADYARYENARVAYQAVKASTDKKIDTEFNSMMIRDMTGENKKDFIKDKGAHAVDQSIKTYDNVASNGLKSRDMATKQTGTRPGGFNNKATTKTASDRYTTQQDKANNSGSVTRYRNSNNRGGS